jgi:hypothetical protein
MVYELFDPFAAILVVVSAVIYRKRWLPHWRTAAIVAVVSVPAGLSFVIAEALQHAPVASGQTLASVTFTVPLSTESLMAVAFLAVVGFAARRTRRRPTAVAGLAAAVLCALATAAYWEYERRTIGAGNGYYVDKTIQASVVVALVGLGSVGHLLRVPPRFSLRVPSRGMTGAVAGCVAILAAAVLTGSVYYGKPVFSYGLMKPGRHTTWERVWVSGRYIVPGDEDTLQFLDDHGMLGDGVPTLVIWSEDGQDNVDLSLTLSNLDHTAGRYGNQVYGLGPSAGLAGAGAGGTWTAAQTAALRAIEQDIATSPAPLTLVTANPALAAKLDAWAGAHPRARLTVRLMPGLPGPA